MLLALCVTGAFALRVLPFHTRVFGPGWLLPSGDADVLYHLRRIELAVRAWPRVPDFDAWMNFPRGGFAPWPPLFDFLAATIARASGVESTRVAMVLPPLLGALALLPLWALVRPLAGPRFAWLGIVLFAALPANVAIGALGRADHHVAEVLLQLWAYAWLARDLRAIEAGAPVRVRTTVGLGLLLGAALLTWAASMLYLWVVPAVTGLWLCAARDARQRAVAARHVAFAFASAAATCAPWVAWNVWRGRAAFAYYHLSLLTLALCLGAAGLVLAIAWVVAAVRSDRPQRAASRLGVAAIVAGAPLIEPHLRQNLLDGLGFVGRDHGSFVSEIAESAPLIASSVTRAFALQHVGNGHWLLPPFCVWLVVRALRERRDASDLLLAVWSINVTALAFAQVRFLYHAAPVIAVLPGLAGAFARRIPATARAALAGVGAFAILPGLAYYWGEPLRGRHVPLAQLDRDLVGFLGRVDERTPRSEASNDPDRGPAYGVFAPWDLGHSLLVIAGRAVVANNFGDQMEGDAFDTARHFYLDVRSEDSAVEALNRRRCRFLVTTTKATNTAAVAGGPLPFASRLHQANGSDTEAGPGAGRLRLLVPARGRDNALPPYKLFELVRGADVFLTGASEPRLEVITHVEVEAHAFLYARTVHAHGSDGRVRLAHPGTYRVRAGDRDIGSFVVSPEAIGNGQVLRVTVPP